MIGGIGAELVAASQDEAFLDAASHQQGEAALGPVVAPAVELTLEARPISPMITTRVESSSPRRSRSSTKAVPV